MAPRLLLAFAGALLVAGCGDRPIQVSVRQPIDFPHAKHLKYFSSGQHRRERIQMHLTALGIENAPDELAQGRCSECHADLVEKKACAGCHVLFQDAALRENRPLRRCVACHRGAWSGNAARIADTDTCLACHPAKPTVLLAGERRPELTFATARDVGLDPTGKEDLAWVQINTVRPNVYFSHRPHVRASVACTTCHEDVKDLSAPPTSLKPISMTRCFRCHQALGVSTDCLTCHK